jgi:hypothetical protein
MWVEDYAGDFDSNLIKNKNFSNYLFQNFGKGRVTASSITKTTTPYLCRSLKNKICLIIG